LKKYIRDYLFLFGVAGTVVILDQWTKALVEANIPFGETWSPWTWLEPYARLVHWSNTGAAFGMFQNMGVVFAILAFVVALAILYFYPQIPRSDWPLRLALGLQLGGALGNLIDRLTQDFVVTDFVSVGNFPVFNIADASISLGVALLVVGMYFKEREERQGKQAPPDGPASLDDSAHIRELDPNFRE
jgi:signal peptidase II